MLNLPILRWGQAYTSLEQDHVIHFLTGETLARVSQANPGLLGRDMRHAQRARDVLTEIPIPELIGIMKKAADLYLSDVLPMGDGAQSPDDFARQQSASTGLPEHLCKANMKKNHFVLSNMDRILDALTRGLDLGILTRGYGVESRGVTVSYQSQAPVLGLVLPSNSPGVHTLWLPVIPMQVGLVLKPGPQEPWTPYRMAAAFFEAGVPREAISIYPGLGDIGAEVVRRTRRSLIFGGTATVERYKGDPRVQVHGPGFSKILLGDDVVDHWETYLDVMADSIFANSGRGCINCSGIWASRHTREIAKRSQNESAQSSRNHQRIREPALRRSRFPELPRQSGQASRPISTARCRACHRPLWSASGREGTLRVSAADHDPLRVLRGAAREHRVHVSVLERRQVPARGDAEENRTNARLQRDHPGLAIPADAD